MSIIKANRSLFKFCYQHYTTIAPKTKQSQQKDISKTKRGKKGINSGILLTMETTDHIMYRDYKINSIETIMIISKDKGHIKDRLNHRFDTFLVKIFVPEKIFPLRLFMTNGECIFYKNLNFTDFKEHDNWPRVEIFAEHIESITWYRCTRMLLWALGSKLYQTVFRPARRKLPE